MRPRDLVLSHLRSVGEVADPGGLASAALSEAIGYQGTNVAFAQLLHEMERSGLIEREVRGKRTYRITLSSAASAAGAASVPAPGPLLGAGSVSAPGSALGAGSVPGAGTVDGIDYDELARRLLAEVVRRVAAPDDSAVASSDDTAALRAENARLRQLLAETRPEDHADEGAARLLERLLNSRRGDDPSQRSA